MKLGSPLLQIIENTTFSILYGSAILKISTFFYSALLFSGLKEGCFFFKFFPSFYLFFELKKKRIFHYYWVSLRIAQHNNFSTFPNFPRFIRKTSRNKILETGSKFVKLQSLKVTFPFNHNTE